MGMSGKGYSAHSRARVLFRMINQALKRCLVVEAFEPCSIISVCDLVDEQVPLFVRVEAIASGIFTIGRVPAHGL